MTEQILEKQIDQNGEIDIETAFQESHVQDILDKLDQELVGLKSVKNKIKEMAALLLVDRIRKSLGLNAGAPSLHMTFLGNPGMGKTTVAMRMAEILYRLEYIRKENVMLVTRDDLVGQGIGQTAPKTREVLNNAMGGVLLVDEAYTLYRPDHPGDFGLEAIEILMQVMENQRDDLVVILAGYKDQMDRFFHSNPGMNSRIGLHIEFHDYGVDSLMVIAQSIVKAQNYCFSPDAEIAFREYLIKRKTMPHFANARSVRNAIDRARLRQANRLLSSGKLLKKQDLITIEAVDILASRVFREGVPDCETES
ncbi:MULTISPECIES: AAA family ATPase [unclassified Anabaena]|jgi:probable Rubsico expression protein CbbX|uniref:AAA family ATPase n=1 Tax=unclassified Anabaena TaxID=2619674 RepID=UPI001447F26A|nr:MULTISPECIES: AAA family ATPase [unclassified Anabaena]MTJ07858.1 AAA family ATPase [Anabaena sp. UHCC 0204]MTJ51640.1 AAA family ATPase [Anabaena sp. UHCC 0253]